ncbi:MAG TPA: hypothetical protein VMM12_06285 [Longimicrobiales bacterium]|nr:hypothetical protein [Longimicrobiales bacterium]
MPGDRKDWLRVVYGRGFEFEAGARRSASRADISVRQVPPELDLAAAPRRELRVRVTVVPSDGAGPWTLWLRDFGPDAGSSAASCVWWRLEPGTWQPLAGTRQCVAEGRGRVRLDVSLRLEGRPATLPRLRFVAEAAGGAG